MIPASFRTGMVILSSLFIFSVITQHFIGILIVFYGSSILKRTLLSYEILRFRLSRIILERKTKLNRKFLKRGHI